MPFDFIDTSTPIYRDDSNGCYHPHHIDPRRDWKKLLLLLLVISLVLGFAIYGYDELCWW